MGLSLRRLAHRWLEWYGCELPYHPGKWRVVERVVQLFRLHEGQGGLVTASRGGVSLELDLRRYMDRTIYYLGTHEDWDTRAFQANIRSGDVVCDVGANIGWYALMAARALAGKGQVHAFEPHPEAFRALQRNVELNRFSNVEAHRCALSDRSGTALLVSDREADTARIAPDTSLGASARVQVTTLDQFATQVALPRLDVIKVDVEGAEVAFLRGASKVLERFRPLILIEVHEGNLARFDATPAELLRVLVDLGYTLHRASRRRLDPLAELPRAPYFANVVALPNSPSSDRWVTCWR